MNEPFISLPLFFIHWYEINCALKRDISINILFFRKTYTQETVIKPGCSNMALHTYALLVIR